MDYHHYFYDADANLVAQLLDTDIEMNVGDAVLIGQEKSIYRIEAILHIPGAAVNIYPWLVSRLSKPQVTSSSLIKRDKSLSADAYYNK